MTTLCRRFVALWAIVWIALLTLAPNAARAADGLNEVRSPHPAGKTMDRFEDIAKSRGLTVFARIDHAAGAARVGRSIRPLQLLIFGNPQGGTPFIECAQTVGIDLPLKALVREDAAGVVWLGTNDPTWIAQRHGVANCPAAENLRKALAGLVDAAVAP